MINFCWTLAVIMAMTVRGAHSRIDAGICNASQATFAHTALTDAYNALQQVYGYETTGMGAGRLSCVQMFELRQRYFGDITQEQSETITSTFDKVLADIESNSVSLYCAQPSKSFRQARSCRRHMTGLIVSDGSSLIGMCPDFFDQTQQRQVQAKYRNATVFDSSEWVTAATSIMQQTVTTHIPQRQSRSKVTGLSMPCLPDNTSDHTVCNVSLHAQAQYLAATDPAAAVLDAYSYALYATAVSIGSTVGMPELVALTESEISGLEAHLQGVRRVEKPATQMGYWAALLAWLYGSA